MSGKSNNYYSSIYVILSLVSKGANFKIAVWDYVGGFGELCFCFGKALLRERFRVSFCI